MDFDEEGYQEYLKYVASRPTLTEERNHPNYWFNRAKALHTSAGALWCAMQPDLEAEVIEGLNLPSWYSLGAACDPVYHMLCGLALEVIMKGVIVSRGEKQPDKHDLNILADLVGVKRTAHEKRLLSFYAESIWWAGRYPIPLKANDQKLRDYGKLATNVLKTPKMWGNIRVLEPSNATCWEKFDELWRKFAAEFNHGC